MRPLRVWVGTVFIGYGVVWLLDAAGVLSANSVIGRWWPIVVIGLGVLALVGERRLAPGPIVLLTIGTALLLNRLTTITISGIIWGGAVIIIGVWLLVDHAWPRTKDPAISQTQDVFALLGGSQCSNRSEHFRHADVTAMLGGVTLDLRQAVPAPGARVDALALLGGVDVIVPPNWRVEVSGLPIFGVYQDKTGGDDVLAPEAPVLKVVATALFGGVEVRNLPTSTEPNKSTAPSASTESTAPSASTGGHHRIDLR